ncbi:MAG: DUF1329 domain-containing protein [Deltaproteobacteria bacterium]|nr:DUF1329 domain-containing protein [Deltaproteobacteria bacterium]
MQAKTIKFWTLLAAAMIISSLMVASLSFGQEMPAPGTTIDKSNYKKYPHLFPEEFLPAFEDGWGLIPPVHANVIASKPISIPKEWLAFSAKNKGKYGLDAQGNLTGGYNREGLPFPDLQRNDKDFATKLMWNFDSRYMFDENIDHARGASFEKRRGEDLRWNNAYLIFLYFKSRMAVSPKPDLPNPLGLYKATMVHFLNPDSIKNTINLTYRYVDPNKPDDTYLYLPSMRRVLRAEAGQRSTPLLGNIAALDDLWGFDGRIPEFTYTIVKEQKVLAITENTFIPKPTTWKKKDLPFPYDNYEVRDTYVIDIKPKDSKYPQSRKRIWLDKENVSNIYYIVVWDRAGKLWKAWMMPFKRHAMLGGRYPMVDGAFGVDVQFGMATYYGADVTVNDQHYTYNDFTPASLLKRGR